VQENKQLEKKVELLVEGANAGVVEEILKEELLARKNRIAEQELKVQNLSKLHEALLAQASRKHVNEVHDNEKFNDAHQYFAN